MPEAGAPVVGVDVSERRGLDVVVLGRGRDILGPPLRALTPGDLGRLLADVAPAVVAIDSPPDWGTEGRSRHCERELAALGISCFRTPSDPSLRARPFYNWMRAGHAAFAAARAAGYPAYGGGPDGRGCALEVFPHACAVALSGVRPPPGTSRRAGTKRRWRTAVLQAQGLDTSTLPTLDAVDAALCALTALAVAEKGAWFALGRPADGFLVLPGSRPPGRYPMADTPPPWDGGVDMVAARTGFEPVSRP